MEIQIQAGEVTIKALLKKTSLGEAIYEALPLKGEVNCWGDEIYFSVPVKRSILKGEGQVLMKIGDLAYWPTGQAFCIFFGPTPISREGEIQAASDVEVFGHLLEDSPCLKKVRDGETILVKRNERASDS